MSSATIGVWVDGDVEAFAGMLRAVAPHAGRLVVAGPDAVDACAAGIPATAELVVGDRWPALVDSLALGDDDHVFVIGHPCAVPPECFVSAADCRHSDPRTATVSVLSNAAGDLSFPMLGTNGGWVLEGRSAERITRRLGGMPDSVPPFFVPIASGPLVLVATDVLLLARDAVAEAPDWESFIGAVSAEAQRRGLFNAMIADAYVRVPTDISRVAAFVDGDTAGRNWLERRYPWLRRGVADARERLDSPLRIGFRAAAARVRGLRVVLDGSCLGPLEMGTQVGVVTLAAALARREEISEVAVSHPGPVPGYAAHLAATDKVRLIPAARLLDGEFDGAFDIAYRAYQPDRSFLPEIWHRVGARVAASILDLIAYQNASYFGSADDWMGYRELLRESASRLDGVTTISHDVVRVVEQERFPIEDRRLFPVPYGTGHIGPNDPIATPDFPGGHVADRFILCLGTNYAHKNRDLAVRTLTELRSRGHEISLVFAGPMVPTGTSYLDELRAHSPESAAALISLGDISSAERNWLLRHAELVLYPTSAEGFGLVPYEAAWMGTPTVFVPFGPLAEIGGTLPVEAASWRPGDLADAAERMLRDPAVGRAQVSALVAAGERYSWDATAAALVEVFHQLLDLPSLRP